MKALFLSTILACLTSIQCSDDPVKISGCTEPTSSNYNPEATEDDGSCNLPRDQYLGAWKGTYDTSFDTRDRGNFNIQITKSTQNNSDVNLDYLCCPKLDFRRTVLQDGKLIIDFKKAVQALPNGCDAISTGVYNGTYHLKADFPIINNRLVGKGTEVEKDDMGKTICAIEVKFDLIK